MRKKWGARVTETAKQIAAPIVKALSPTPTSQRSKDPWLNDAERQAAINARRERRWVPRRRGWLRSS